MVEELINKKVKVFVFKGKGDLVKIYEGIFISNVAFGGEWFMLLDDNTMINIKYVQSIEIIK